ncbi:MAG: hypothetical protein AUJ52_01800 [Elusimicrobia bacterium CG1_02_63_36]|nr:MAG: hypothetical protein AUJ52_01800 [Elusimicrobia bacterium CG1_02_63_36]PIP82443.1 MAG: hypothetical protein COR54_14605 [Elusimicrobia bacterium CG22_combo_CG10-13_8_21_14_all_63_91]PJA14758.1 MAG: hypothetical protein COX66_11775 [Elusimicrobia bacterium CG_4_10_14_0_2_um_filter_63_34]PJB26872.1 MAG: hypothetical protein CO113_01120 [Elusimicrobia bacterium CG_4_9_14_3_um_filter_62_55]
MPERLEWSVDAEVYSRETVFASCRRWSAEASFKITKKGKKLWRVAAAAKPGVSKERLAEIHDGFEDEAMHQELRAGALRDAGKVREAVILRALLSASQDPQ